MAVLLHSNERGSSVSTLTFEVKVRYTINNSRLVFVKICLMDDIIQTPDDDDGGNVGNIPYHLQLLQYSNRFLLILKTSYIA